MNGTERIAAERQRQIEIEGYTLAHDAKHDDEHLAWAAACYLLTERMSIKGDDFGERCWPWEHDSWKPSNDPIRNLEKAGALIAAEIDRLLDKTND